MKPRLYAFLVVLFACCLTACASRGGQNPSPASCVVPASICKPTTRGGTGGGAPTCGQCPASQLMDWLKQTGCSFENLSCADGGTIYLDDHNYWCCTECPDECESEAKSGEGE